MVAEALFKAPKAYLGALNDGSLVRFGALLKDANTGQIVAHMQETGLANNIINSASDPFILLNPLTATSSLAGNIQLAGLKAMMLTLQSLQFLTLGATIGGIGVSVVGFSILSKRLGCINASIEDLSNNVAAHFREQRMATIREHISKTIALCQHAQRAEVLTDRKSELLQIARDLSAESGYFQGEICHLLNQDEVDTEILESLLQGFSLTGNARTECYIRAGELLGAQINARDIGLEYQAMFEDITPIVLAEKMGAYKHGWEESEYSKFMDIQDKATEIVNCIREATNVAISKPYFIDTLIKRNIDTNRFSKTILEEQKEHILLLPA